MMSTVATNAINAVKTGRVHSCHRNTIVAVFSFSRTKQHLVATSVYLTAMNWF